MELPEGLVLEYRSELWITEFRGSLSVFTVSREGKPCSVWVMREYRIAASWSELFIIDLEGRVGKIISKNNEVLVATKKLSTSTKTGKLGFLSS
ncbi:hypothetical protein L1049_023512 [Liquidambar formosana]|uniref:F-box protein n=1 Tax=Liquidambar formosana TaxID=63359 RepID=A0AAP0RYA5_LIQFO